MAILVSPRFLPFLNSRDPRHFRRTGTHCYSAAVSSLARSEREKSGTAILWFKHDLRIDDHPGLLAASRFPNVIPLYVFDRRILSRFSDELLQLVLVAVEDLRNSLLKHGSNLMIRFGNAEYAIQELVKEVKATDIVAEAEVEYGVLRLMDIVEETLASVTSLERTPKLLLWRTPFYDINDLKDLPASYQDFTRLHLPQTSLLMPPTLPGLDVELDWGPLPTFDDVKKFINVNPYGKRESWRSIKELSAEIAFQKRLDQHEPLNGLSKGLELSKSRDSKPNSFSEDQMDRRRPQRTFFVTREGNSIGGGTKAILNALAAYFRYLEGTTSDDWQEVHEKLRNAKSRVGASFGALFGPALHLGIISRRRVYYESIKYEKERNAGFRSPFSYPGAMVTPVVDTICSMEWYWLSALKSQISNNGTHSACIWRWRGSLIHYTVVGDKGPTVLLVHGFGAFLEHYRDNIYAIANSGNRVWAITLLGFGKSEKPITGYTELMWAELLRDFIVEVVGEPVHLVGNSIGGYIVAILAGLWPCLAKSSILINSAGNVNPSYIPRPLSKERPILGPSWLGARLLLRFLRLRIRSIVKNCYPIKPERADDWLIDEMIRASYDPGVLVVLESIFSFNLSIPLNFLLKGYEEKVLVIQGMRDPISDSKSKLAMLREHCAGVTITELDAGHCPHDEKPEEVNSIICDWVTALETYNIP